MADQHVFVASMWDMDPSIDDEEFDTWYVTEHMPKRLACPGFISGRRYRSVSGSPRYMVIYEVESADALNSTEFTSLYSTYNRDTTASPLTVQMVGGMTNLVRNVFLDVTPDTLRTQNG